mmetsp:Transcript_6728/g.10639  ORF Transcript_6728/g.10639 Transcript_6728/m.10639 type:complete len:172 (-) Transcript_6728:739-1254(-)
MGLALCRAFCCHQDEDTGLHSYGSRDEYTRLDGAPSGTGSGRNSGTTRPFPVSSQGNMKNTSNEQKDQLMGLNMPPSVEDEKLFMRMSFRRLQEQQLSAPKECLLCMEVFSEEQPEVKTLCQCGINKNNYHLTCLLEWRARSGKTTCPVCDQELFFQEDDEDEEDTYGVMS